MFTSFFLYRNHLWPFKGSLGSKCNETNEQENTEESLKKKSTYFPTDSPSSLCTKFLSHHRERKGEILFENQRNVDYKTRLILFILSVVLLLLPLLPQLRKHSIRADFSMD